MNSDPRLKQQYAFPLARKINLAVAVSLAIRLLGDLFRLFRSLMGSGCLVIRWLGDSESSRRVACFLASRSRLLARKYVLRPPEMFGRAMGGLVTSTSEAPLSQSRLFW